MYTEEEKRNLLPDPVPNGGPVVSRRAARKYSAALPTSKPNSRESV
jgi:hypothetical protein